MSEIYEVRVGETVIGTFTSESKARSFAKVNRDKGKLRIIHRYIDDKKVKKVAPAPKPKVEKPKKTVVKPKVEKPKKIEKPKKVAPAPKPEKPKAEKPKKVVPKKPEKPPIWKQDYNKISEPDNGFFILSDGSIFSCFVSDSCDVEPEESADGIQYYVNAIRYGGNLDDEVFILLPVREGDSVEDIVKTEYGLTVVDFVEVEDAYELWDAIDENKDQETIDDFARRYPKLFAGIKKKAVSKPVPPPSKPAPPKPAPKTKPAVSKPVPPPSKKPMTNAAFLKGLNKALCKMNNPDVPVFSSQFKMIDSAHVMALSLTNRAGKSLFGFADGDPRMHIALDELLEKSGGTFEFDAEGNALTQKGMVEAMDLEPQRVTLNLGSQLKMKFTVDARAFKTEFDRMKKIVGKRDFRSIRLYGNKGDLMMSAKDSWNGYGATVDVGDGTGEKGSSYPAEYFPVLLDLMALSDTPCILEFEKDLPLKLTCTSGDWLIEAYLAPRIEKEE